MATHTEILIELQKFERRRLKAKKYFSEAKFRLQWKKQRSIDMITLDNADKGLRANVYEIKTERGSFDSRFFDATTQLDLANLAIAFPEIFFLKSDIIEVLIPVIYCRNYFVVDDESADDPEYQLKNLKEELKLEDWDKQFSFAAEGYLQILAEQTLKDLGIIIYTDKLKFKVLKEAKDVKLPTSKRTKLYKGYKTIIDKIVELKP